MTENSNGTSAKVIFGYDWEKSVAEGTTYAFESGCAAGRDNKVGGQEFPVVNYIVKNVRKP